ncbi:uncharacterized protein PHACADRAFT_257879 [Phanerochaete carnosa HHB-10118-sp]|uniref:F-box domain-containing protein n=1 Tax=Phanerochaete carnosa (strain HHB-10118-sp) TaxID=650164 RepID=K5UVY0_PHACS|nr:uncharacterized protein PHACADRAFT_257879 [Phanerochaete carnosa HHB-10118-sp]EKM54201.1 hypothetical protein PHACADRAFT_257879 [Phanerochaete carnosa HHB-10118-sp]
MPHPAAPDLLMRLMHGPKTILSLPDDIMLEIITFIRVKDILALRQTCKKLCRLTKSRWVWTNAVKRHALGKGLPIPASNPGLKSLSAAHLEARVVHAAKLHDNWYSKNPTPRRAIEFQARCMLDEVADTPASPVSQVLFMPARSGEFLLVLAGKRLSCWEVPLDGSGAYEIVCVHEDGVNIEQVIVNQESDNGCGEFAFWAQRPGNDAHAKLYVASLDTFHGRIQVKMSCLALQPIAAPLHLMHGDFIVTGSHPVLWYLASDTKKVNYARLVGGVVMEGSNAVLAVKIIGKYVLIARQQEFQLFAIPRHSPELGMEKTVELIATFHWDSPAREVVIIARDNLARNAPSTPSKSWATGTVTILLREANEGFNTLKQYDLLPNIDRRPSPGPKTVLPFVLPSGCTRAIPVAPSCCGLSVWPSGRGFWVQTDNVEANHTKYPARCIMGFDVVSPRQAQEISAEHGDKLACSPGVHLDANIVHFCDGPLYARRCDMSHILRKRYALKSADLEDVIGRLAIGDKDGKVEVLDYA